MTALSQKMLDGRSATVLVVFVKSAVNRFVIFNDVFSVLCTMLLAFVRNDCSLFQVALYVTVG